MTVSEKSIGGYGLLNENWLFGITNTESKKHRADCFREIGERTFSFFLDTAVEQGFEDREGQWTMSCEIVDAMQKKKHIAIEAGVGIGKSFAYIVPLLFYHQKYHCPILIATSTIALQDQLASDIKIIEDMIDYHPTVTIAKGQTHFLCKKRFDEFFLDKKTRQKYSEIYEDVERDGHERSDWNADISDFLWNQMNVKEYNPMYCRQRCSYRGQCYYHNLRQRLPIEYGIILCNQDLLAVNMRKRLTDSKELFPHQFEFVVIDEAHNLESRVRSSYTQDMNYRKMFQEADAARQINRSIGEPLDNKLREYHKLLNEVFTALQEQIRKQDAYAEKEGREIKRYSVEPKKLRALEKFCGCIHDINFYISMDFGLDDYSRNRDYSREIEALEEQERFFKSLKAEDSEDIFWMTTKGKSRENICLSSCPKEVDKLTSRLLFQSEDFTTILTSATITSGNSDNYLMNYRYFINNIKFPYKKGIVSEPKQSPFAYDEHAMIYYTENMPHPSRQREQFIAAGVQEIIRLLRLTEGKTLILFTAKTDMREVFQLLQGKVPYQLMMQKEGDSQKEVLDKFKSNINSVLLGTGSYWEGISVEGMALSSVIIFKLPFPVPEPIIDYKCSLSGDKHLMEVLVPEMVIKLKQGIGRLIRNQTDKGIVSIIDSRVGEESRAPYKQIIWDSLPIKNKTNNFEVITEFYQKIITKEDI